MLQLWIAKYTPLTQQYSPLVENIHPRLSNILPCSWNMHPWLSNILPAVAAAWCKCTWSTFDPPKHYSICTNTPSALAQGFEWGIYSRDVHMYVRMCQSCLGMSICDHTRNVNLHSCSLIHAVHEHVDGGRSLRRTTFLGDGEWEGQRRWAFALHVFGRVKCRNECWMQLVSYLFHNGKRVLCYQFSIWAQKNFGMMWVNTRYP